MNSTKIFFGYEIYVAPDQATSWLLSQINDSEKRNLKYEKVVGGIK